MVLSDDIGKAMLFALFSLLDSNALGILTESVAVSSVWSTLAPPLPSSCYFYLNLLAFMTTYISSVPCMVVHVCVMQCFVRVPMCCSSVCL